MEILAPDSANSATSTGWRTIVTRRNTRLALQAREHPQRWLNHLRALAGWRDGGPGLGFSWRGYPSGTAPRHRDGQK
jgi:hypothetical protein